MVTTLIAEDIVLVQEAWAEVLAARQEEGIQKKFHRVTEQNVKTTSAAYLRLMKGLTHEPNVADMLVDYASGEVYRNGAKKT